LQSSVALQRSAGDRDRESALELRESTLAAREEKLRADAASIAERESALQRTQRQYEADRTATEAEMRQLQALQKDMVIDSAAWRDTLAADRAKIQVFYQHNNLFQNFLIFYLLFFVISLSGPS
jgi:uncharacterized protein involved in exopolysaccharide biosynthesis